LFFADSDFATEKLDKTAVWSFFALILRRFLVCAPTRIPAIFHFMNEGRTLFAQHRDFLPQYEFDQCVARYHGSRRIRKLPAYE
jgi:hypothetical protein